MLLTGGGLLNLASRAFADAGLIETNAPRIGDIGCVKTALGPVLAINVGHQRWAWKGGRDLSVSSDWRVLKAWEV